MVIGTCRLHKIFNNSKNKQKLKAEEIPTLDLGLVHSLLNLKSKKVKLDKF